MSNFNEDSFRDLEKGDIQKLETTLAMRMDRERMFKLKYLMDKRSHCSFRDTLFDIIDSQYEVEKDEI